MRSPLQSVLKKFYLLLTQLSAVEQEQKIVSSLRYQIADSLKVYLWVNQNALEPGHREVP